jgi:hypothetical protein
VVFPEHYIKLNRFLRPVAVRLRSSFFFFFLLLFLPSPASSLLIFLAGDLTQWHLPVGMQEVNFEYCKGLTGTAASG